MSEVIQDSLGFWVPLCGFRHSRYWISDIFSIEFPLVELRIPKPRIPDSTSKIFPDSGIAGLPYIVTWGENFPRSFSPGP